MQSPDSPLAVSHILRDAANSSTPVRLVGNGTWLNGGGPFVSQSHLSLRALNAVVAYEPGDLVATVGAGMTLGELRALAGEAGQMFAAAPYGTDDATIGACVATASPAPLALGDLAMRDLVLGLTAVTGTGDIVRGGGRVVKNVAGFDLVRLHTRAFGTLGAITEVTLRLHAIPQVDAIMVGTLTDDLAHTLPRLVANRAPLPMILHLVPGRAPELWARISGNRARAAALTDRVTALGVSQLTTVLDASLLRETPTDAIVLSARAPLSEAVSLVAQARAHFPDATLQYDPAKGTLRAVIPQVRRSADVVPANEVPAYVVHQGREHPRALSPLEQGLKRALDPHNICNRLVY